MTEGASEQASEGASERTNERNVYKVPNASV